MCVAVTEKTTNTAIQPICFGLSLHQLKVTIHACSISYIQYLPISYLHVFLSEIARQTEQLFKAVLDFKPV